MEVHRLNHQRFSVLTKLNCIVISVGNNNIANVISKVGFVKGKVYVDLTPTLVGQLLASIFYVHMCFFDWITSVLKGDSLTF